MEKKIQNRQTTKTKNRSLADSSVPCLNFDISNVDYWSSAREYDMFTKLQSASVFFLLTFE